MSDKMPGFSLFLFVVLVLSNLAWMSKVKGLEDGRDSLIRAFSTAGSYQEPGLVCVNLGAGVIELGDTQFSFADPFCEVRVFPDSAIGYCSDGAFVRVTCWNLAEKMKRPAMRWYNRKGGSK